MKQNLTELKVEINRFKVKGKTKETLELVIFIWDFQLSSSMFSRSFSSINVHIISSQSLSSNQGCFKHKDNTHSASIGLSGLKSKDLRAQVSCLQLSMPY